MPNGTQPQYGLPLQRLPAGGAIEYKPNWGQPITEAGEWRGTPVVSQGAGIDPFTVLDKNQNELWEHYKRRETILKGYGLSQEAHNKTIAQMQQEYDEGKLKFISTRLQLDDIKQGMASGQIDPDNGVKAMMQLVAPQGTVEAMFPKPQRAEQRGRFTPGEFKSYVKEFEEAAESTIVNPWGWGKESRKYSDPEQLKEQYLGVRAKYGYDTDMNTTEKKAFDLAWDQALSGNKHTIKAWKQLKETDPDVFMSRTYDARLLNIAARKAQGQPISPMAKALKPKLSMRQKIQMLSPVGIALLSKELAAKRQAAAQKLPTVSTDADYDKLPSGAQFTDPQGNVRTKP
jgi:hypothetical protein